MNGRAIFLLFLSIPATCLAAAPTLIGKVDLRAPPYALSVSSDGKRAVALLERSADAAAGLVVIDTSVPSAPVARGFLPGVSGIDLALGHDGESALVLVRLEEQKYNTATRHEVVAIDVSAPDAPKVAWRRELMAQQVVLAPDAAAYAASEPPPETDGRWQSKVIWLDATRPAVTVEGDRHAPFYMEISAGGAFLATGSASDLRIVELRADQPVVYEQEHVSYRRYHCLAAVLRDGHVVVDDERAPRLGIYAPQDAVPRVSVLPHDAARLCHRLNADADQGGGVILADHTGRLRRVDLRRPARATLAGSWQLPLAAAPLAAAGSLLYAGAEPRSNALRVFRLDPAAAGSVDWPALGAAHRKVMDRYNQELRESNPLAFLRAPQRLEEAGVLQALDAPVTRISPQRAAAILNDYGFLAWKTDPNYAEAALRRAIALDPERALARLNLADGLRERLPGLSDPATRAKRVAEIQALYRKYLALGGKTTDNIEDFLKLAELQPEDSDICHAIARYANAGRLAELVLHTATNVRAGERQLDLFIAYEGSAQMPAVYAFDSDTDIPYPVAVPGEEPLLGGDALGVVVHPDTAHLLYFRGLRHPVASLELNGERDCAFAALTTERVGPAATEPALCRSLSEGKGPPSIRFETPSPIEDDSVAERYSETHAGNMQVLDFANDGKPVPVVELHLSSGAGAGCGATFYAVLDRTGTRLASGTKHEQLMKLQEGDPSRRLPIRACGNAPRFFAYQGKIFFETKPARWPADNDWDSYHLVARLNRDEVVDVCDFRFETTVSVLP